MVTRLLVMVTRLARHGDEHGPYRESSVECGGVKTKGARCRQGSRSGADCGSRPECADQATLNGALVELPRNGAG
jgi:hypothetical protein